MTVKLCFCKEVMSTTKEIFDAKESTEGRSRWDVVE